MNRVVTGIACLLTTQVATVSGQGFVNLNFESANIVTAGSPYLVFATDALPGWTNGFPPGSTIFYNTVSLGAPAVSIHDSNDSANPPIQGHYTVGLQGQNPGTGSASIAQTGIVPAGTESLRFFAQLGSLQVSLNGQVVPYIPVGSGANYTVYGCDISAFAGQVAELRFTTLPNTSAAIDNILFSSSPIPEPAAVSLLGIGVLSMLGLRSRFRLRR